MGTDKHYLIIFFLINQGFNILTVASTFTVDDLLNDLNDEEFPRKDKRFFPCFVAHTESNQDSDHGRYTILDGRIRLKKKFSGQKGIQKKSGGNMEGILTNCGGIIRVLK